MKYIIIICSILIFVSCQEQEDDNSKFKTVIIKSVGNVETLPDIATFYVSLSCVDKSITESKECLINKTSELTSKLTSFKIPGKDILTTSINMNKSYTWKNNSRVFEGYKSNTTVHITLKKIELLEDIYTDLIENKNTTINGLQYSSSKIDSLQNEAYINALKKSEILAEKLLENIPEKRKEVLKIGNIQISSSSPNSIEINNNSNLRKSSEYKSQVNKTVSISNGTVKINAILFVEYQIK
jgi:uncharacterized protein YggE